MGEDNRVQPTGALADAERSEGQEEGAAVANAGGFEGAAGVESEEQELGERE
jgi:hypothetical protein